MGKRASKAELERRRKISVALKRYHRRKKAAAKKPKVLTRKYPPTKPKAKPRKKRAPKAELERRRKISVALKRYHKEKAAKEKQRRLKISEALLSYHRGKKAAIAKAKKAIVYARHAEPLPKEPAAAMAERMRRSFILARDILHTLGYEGINYSVHPNRDGSIDAQLNVSLDIDREPGYVVIDLENAVNVPKGVWVGAGAYFSPDVEDEDAKINYYLHMGMVSQQAYPQRSTSSPENFSTARDIIKNMTNTGWHKPVASYIRFFWNAEGKRPRQKQKGKLQK